MLRKCLITAILISATCQGNGFRDEVMEEIMGNIHEIEEQMLLNAESPQQNIETQIYLTGLKRGFVQSLKIILNYEEKQ